MASGTVGGVCDLPMAMCMKAHTNTASGTAGGLCSLPMAILFMRAMKTANE